MIKQLLFTISFLALSAICFAQSSSGDLPKKDNPIFKMQEFNKRGGLPNIFHTIASQHQIKIAYLGGSITGADNGWRQLTYDWFRLKYPEKAFYQLNYAVGGTGSVLGVFRLDAMLAEKPDLIFVEFAVNDENDMSVNRRVLAMEGIVRKTWSVLPNTDICFLYTTAKRFCDTMIQKGKRMDAVLDHEKIASHYSIPSIDMGLTVVRMASEGKVVLSANPSENANKIVFWGTGDDYHPLAESGHALYAGTIVKYLEQMSSSLSGKKHQLPPVYRADNWTDSKMLFPQQTQIAGNWVSFDDNKKDQLGGPVPSLYKAMPGATMSFKFIGTELGIYDVIGPGSGSIDVTIDGQTQEVKRFDHNCSFWHRHNIFLTKLNSGVHNVRIRVADKQFDKRSVMKPGDDAAAYAEYNWYPAAILIVGKLITN